MELYIGTKLVRAVPMGRQAYNDFRGWDLPADEEGDDQGYLVEYLDGGKPNTDQYAGYVSWSPAEQFDNAYSLTDGISFGLAVDGMKRGYKVARHGWNGKDMFIFLVDGSQFKVNRPPLLGIYKEGEDITYKAHIDMRHADGSIGTWSPNSNDALATDWYIVP